MSEPTNRFAPRLIGRGALDPFRMLFGRQPVLDYQQADLRSGSDWLALLRQAAADSAAFIPAARGVTAARSVAATHNANVAATGGRWGSYSAAGTAPAPAGTVGGATRAGLTPPGAVAGTPGASGAGAATGGGAASTAGAGTTVANAQAQAAAHNAQVIITHSSGAGQAIPQASTTARVIPRSTSLPPPAAGATTGAGATTAGASAGTAGAAASSPTAAAAASTSAAARSGGFFRGMRRPFTSQPGVRPIGRHNLGRATSMLGLGSGAAYAPFYVRDVARALPDVREQAAERRAELGTDGVPFPDTPFGPGGAASRAGRAALTPIVDDLAAARERLFGPRRPAAPATSASTDAPAATTTPTGPATRPSDDVVAGILGGLGAGDGAGAGGLGGGSVGGGPVGGGPVGGGVPRNLFQLQETDEERALVARAIADIQRRRDEGTAALREGWGNVARINTAASEKARGMVAERGDRGEAIWTGAEERTREEAARRAAAAGQFEGRAAIDIDELGGAEDFVRFMQSQAPAERALAEAEQRAFAEDLEFLAQMSGQQGEAYAADLNRFAAAMEFERQAQHDRDVQARIDMERMALAQMEFQANQAALAARNTQRDNVVMDALNAITPLLPVQGGEGSEEQVANAAAIFSQRTGLGIGDSIDMVMNYMAGVGFQALLADYARKVAGT